VFAKLVVLILSVGACACVLLAARQVRVQAAHDLADARLRVMQRDNELWELRARIAAKVTPANVQRLAAKITPLKPIGGEFWVDPAAVVRRAARQPSVGDAPVEGTR
jgi:hypothetical protein